MSEFAPAIRTVLAAYRSTDAHITQEQITAAWSEYEALRGARTPAPGEREQRQAEWLDRIKPQADDLKRDSE